MKKKNPSDIITFHKCMKNHDHMLYCSWDVVRDRCNCYLWFWAIFWPRFLICLKRGYFGGKLTNTTITTNTTFYSPLCYNVSKKYWQIMRYKVLKFGPNWLQISHLPLQGIFLKNWLLFLSNSNTPSQYYND